MNNIRQKLRKKTTIINKCLIRNSFLIICIQYWFGARVVKPSSFALVGCTVAPGFDFNDFILGDRDMLLSKFPEHKDCIESLTRV